MNAHFFDINTLIWTNSKVWVVSKLNPKKPIIKIDQSDFNLIKKGVFKKHEQKINIGGQNYWITEELMNQIKLKCSKYKVDITTLHFSMQEFMNPEIIEQLDYKIWSEHFINLKNTNDDIYIICSKNTKSNYEIIIKKVEEKLKELGLFVKEYYFISETFFNRNEDEVSHKKVRLLLQHLIGLKTEDDKFTDKEITRYQTIFYYDDEKNSIEFAKNCNDLLKLLNSNSEEDIKSKVKSIISENEPILTVNQVTYNKVNKFISKSIHLTLERIIKTFERFKFKF